jgi:hypothetical protein
MFFPRRNVWQRDLFHGGKIREFQFLPLIPDVVCFLSFFLSQFSLIPLQTGSLEEAFVKLVLWRSNWKWGSIREHLPDGWVFCSGKPVTKGCVAFIHGIRSMTCFGFSFIFIWFVMVVFPLFLYCYFPFSSLQLLCVCYRCGYGLCV